MDSHERPARGLHAARSVATFAYFGRGNERLSPVGVSSACFPYATASDALIAAVEYVSAEPSRRYAAVTAGEFSVEPEDSSPPELRSIARVAEPGQVVVSLAALELARPWLSEDYEFRLLGSAHLAESTVERLYFVEHPSLNAVARISRPVKVPRRSTTFFGRGRELEELCGLIELSRLVTVLGMTGVGKSSLLQRLVAEIGDRFPDGVGHFDLSLVEHPDLLIASLLKVLDAPKLLGEGHADAFIAHFRRRKYLLVLDNVEHVRSEVAWLVKSALDECPDVAILVGSQLPLGLTGEARFRMEGLEAPRAVENWQALQEFDAVALFIDRVQMIDPNYRLKERDAVPIAAICRLLEGNPLAIELAAAKTSTFSLRQILNRADDRLFLLNDPGPYRPERHRSLDAALRWTYGHMVDEAKLLLRRISVFTGALSIDQAAEVCGDARLPEPALFDAFAELVGASFLAASNSTALERRFRIPAIARLFAAKLLRETDERDRLVDRHRKWCAELCQMASVGLAGSEQLLWLERLEAHLADIRALIERNCQKGGNGDLAVRTLLAINQYFFERHYLLEGFQLAARVVEARPCKSSLDLYRVLNLVGILAGRLGDEQAAREYAIRSICGARAAGNVAGVAKARLSLAFYYEDRSDFRRARRHYLWTVGVFRRIGTDTALLKALLNVAGIEPQLGLMESARAHLAEAEQMLCRNPSATMRAYFHQNSSHYSLAAGEAELALDHATHALAVLVEAQDLNAIGTSFRNIAYALEALGDFRLAAQFAGANRKLTHQLHQRQRPHEAASFEQFLGRLAAELGDEGRDRMMFEGAESTPDELLAALDTNLVISTE